MQTVIVVLISVVTVAFFANFFFRARSSITESRFESAEDIRRFMDQGGKITQLTLHINNPKPESPTNPYRWTLRDFALHTFDSNARTLCVAMNVVSLYRPDALFVCVLGEGPVETALKALKKTELI